MNGGSLEVTTEEQRERLHTARKNGGQCAGCGRALAADEPVYIEQFTILEQSTISGRRTSVARAPVGVECAAPEFLQETEDADPEQCAGCGRPVYYHGRRKNRHRALCARPCANRVVVARRAAKTGEVD
jgi:hypothetical protein